MARQITDHIVSRDQAAQLRIEVLDEPGQGGANHHYQVSWGEPVGKPTIAELEKILEEGNAQPNLWPQGIVTLDHNCFIRFQNGPIKEHGVNGITQEALLAVVIDRLRSFQAGPFASEYNQEALVHTEQALHALQRRTRERLARGVEGTNQQ